VAAGKHEPSRFKLAFLSAWNLAALGVAGVIAAAMKNPMPIVAAGALEAGWLAFATRPRASRLLFPEAHEAADAAARAARRTELRAGLSAEDRERVERLEERRAGIMKLCGENTHVAREVLLAEVSRLEDIVDSFVDVAATARRWSAFLAAVDADDLESELRRYEDQAARAADEATRALARKNADVLLRRREQLVELRGKLAQARTQLDLIESTFRMIANEIMLMRDTDQLRTQLDDLVVGVQAVREVATSDAGAGDPDDLRRRAAAGAAAQAARRT
jgi:hypothetical protein